MDISKQQLDKLNVEIDAISLKIDEEKAKWETAASDDKAEYYKDSIKVLNSRWEVLNADRSRLHAALPPPALAPAPGKPRRSHPTPPALYVCTPLPPCSATAPPRGPVAWWTSAVLCVARRVHAGTDLHAVSACALVAPLALHTPPSPSARSLSVCLHTMVGALVRSLVRHD
jgi:hypothetical protein